MSVMATVKTTVRTRLNRQRVTVDQRAQYESALMREVETLRERNRQSMGRAR
jgi:hypothetical protein